MNLKAGLKQSCHHKFDRCRTYFGHPAKRADKCLKIRQVVLAVVIEGINVHQSPRRKY